MGKAERSRRGNTNEQKYSIFVGRTLSGCGEYVQSQNGIYFVWES